MPNEHRMKREASSGCVALLTVSIEHMVCQLAEIATALNQIEAMYADGPKMHETEPELSKRSTIEVELHEHQSGLVE